MSTPVVVVSGAGTSGPRGNGWLSGTGAPSNGVGLDGDFYLDTVNVGVYYGPKTAGVWGSSHPFSGPLTNYSAVIAPTVSNDNTQGYSRGSVWINTVTNSVYVATSVATGAAVWVQTLPVGNAAGGDLSGTLPNPTVARINGTSVPTTPSANQLLVTTGTSVGSWKPNPPGLTLSTGVYSGGILSVNGTNPAAFDITQADAWLVDYVTNPANPTVTRVSIPAQTVTLSGAALTRSLNWWCADSSGTIFSQPAEPTTLQRRTAITLGATGSVIGTGQIFSIQTLPQVLVSPTSQLYDVIHAIGPFSEFGNQVSANGANLRINKTAGVVFAPSFGANVPANQSPHEVPSPAETPLQWKYITRLAGSEGADTQLIDPTRYDNNGVITLVGGGTNTATIQRVWLFGTGVAGVQTLISYGQSTYSSLSAAAAAAGNTSFVLNPDITNANGTLIGWIAMIRTATNLSDPNQATFIPAGRFVTP